jgi:uncharacterized protein (DUF1501 family)
MGGFAPCRKIGPIFRGPHQNILCPRVLTNHLYQGRDLMPTTDLRAVAKGVLADLYGVPSGLLAEKIFPGSLNVPPMQGLVA